LILAIKVLHVSLSKKKPLKTYFQYSRVFWHVLESVMSKYRLDGIMMALGLTLGGV